MPPDFDEMTQEEKEAFFAEIARANPELNPDGYEFFALVVDGKVSVIFTPTKEVMQEYIDTLSSNPIVVKLTPAQKNVVLRDWNYDEQTGDFSQP